MRASASLRVQWPIVITVVLGLALGHEARAQYEVHDLGADIQVHAINGAGQVVGCKGGHAILVTPEDTNNDDVPDRWFRETSPGSGVNALMADLGTLPGGSTSCARDINDAGQVVGWSEATCIASCSSGKMIAGFFWENNVMVPLYSPTNLVPSGESQAFGISEGASACKSCTPNCGGRKCGDDGCGGTCGSCAAFISPRVCNESSGQCVPCSGEVDCTGRECGDDGCGGTCGTCEQDEACNPETGNCLSCEADCTGRECGDDGCGGSCESCESGLSCVGQLPRRIVGVAKTLLNSPLSGPFPLVWEKVAGAWVAVPLGGVGVVGEAYDIHDEVGIAGWSFAPSSGHATVWESIVDVSGNKVWATRELGTLSCPCGSQVTTCDGCLQDQSHSRGFGINVDLLTVNQRAQIVGASDDGAIGELDHPFIYEDCDGDRHADVGEMLEMGSFGGNGPEAGLDINGCGQVVGYSPTQGGGANHAFTWYGGGCQNAPIHDLNDQIGSSPGWKLSSATGIHNLGVIVGQGTFDDANHAFVLTPTVEVVDPNPEMLAGGELTGVSTDVELLGSSVGRQVDGLAADGVTRVLLRMGLGGAAAAAGGTVTFVVSDGAGSTLVASVGTLREVDGTVDYAANAEVTVDVVTLSDGRAVALAILTAPIDFVRAGNTDDECLKQRGLTITVSFAPAVDSPCAGAFSVERPLKLHRPPIMLIHGIWGSRSTWGWALTDTSCNPELSFTGRNDPYLYNHEYKNTNDLAFIVNLDEPRIGVAIAVNDIRDSLTIAATQADIFAHSMGGILSRLHAANLTGEYVREDNYGAGDIHKLVTVDSPHFGSPLACVLLTGSNQLTLLGRIVDQIFGCPECGGLFDMRPETGAFASSLSDLLDQPDELPEVELPVAVLTGSGGSDVLGLCVTACPGPRLIVVAIKFAIWYITGYAPIDQPERYLDWLYSQDESAEALCQVVPPVPPFGVLFPTHDIAVTLTSQLGGLPLVAGEGGNHFGCLDGIHFAYMPGKNQDASARAMVLLNAGVDSTDFEPGLPPGVPEDCPNDFCLPGAPSAATAVTGRIASSVPLIEITKPAPPPSLPDTFAPGTTISVDVQAISGSGFTPKGVVALLNRGSDGDGFACGACSPATLSVKIPDDAVGMRTISAFAYDDDLDVEGSTTDAVPVRIQVIPNVAVKNIRADPSTIYLFDDAPLRQISVVATYDDTVKREMSGCKVPDCCTPSCPEFESEECDSFVLQQDITFVVANPSIARVDCQGFVTGLRAGQTEVTVTYTGTNYGPACPPPFSAGDCFDTVQVRVQTVPCDFFGDGEVSLDDFVAFADCFFGNLTPQCFKFFDFYDDGFIDLDDFNAWLDCYIGPRCDCDGNGELDLLDLLLGLSDDANGNGIPDDCEPTEVGIDLVINGDFLAGDLDPWMSEFTGNPPAEGIVWDTDCLDQALRLFGYEGEGSAFFTQIIGVGGLGDAASLTLGLDVRIDAQGPSDNFPAFATIAYRDGTGNQVFFNRLFCIAGPQCSASGSAGLSSVVPLPPGVWQHQAFDLAQLSIPLVAEIEWIRLTGTGTSFDVSFDNVALLVDGLDCNGNGVLDDSDVATGSSVDCDANGTPDECERVQLFVDADAVGAGNGTSWADAYTDLQDALAAAATGPAEIWVAEGTYAPVGPDGSRFATFQLRSCLEIYGGFVGTETDRDQRSPATNVTTLTGDLNSDDDTLGNGENSYHIVTGSEADGTAILDGFVITAGNSNNPLGAENRGAGMFNVTSGGPTVRNCTFIGHSAGHGGAIYNRDVQPTIINCRFLANVATSGQGGGAIYNWRSNSLFINCMFSGNVGESQGGAIVLEQSDPVLVNCTVSGNTSTGSRSGGILSFGSNPTLTNCVLWGNTDSGGMDESAQFESLSGTPVVNYSAIQGLTGSLGGVGNIGGDPLFVDADGADDVLGTIDDKPELSALSPCIDSGDNAAIDASIVTDLNGNPRLIHDPLTPETGSGAPPVIDMGAVEYFPDCNGNGVYDGEELAAGTVTDLNYNLVPDVCESLFPPAPLPEPIPENKNRFVSFVMPSGAAAGVAAETALQIELTILNHVCSAESDNLFEPCTTNDDCTNGVCDAPFAASEGQLRYVNVVKTCQGGASSTGEVICRSLDDCAIDEECLQFRTCDGTTDLCATSDDCPEGVSCLASMSCPDDVFKPPFLCATTGCEAEYRVWANDLAGGVLHVYGPGIVPARSEYSVRQLPAACSGIEASCALASDALMIATARWADLTADGATNARDIATASDKVKPIPEAIRKPRTMLIPGILNPFRNVNVLELQNTVDAVKSLPMSGLITGPEDCGT